MTAGCEPPRAPTYVVIRARLLNVGLHVFVTQYIHSIMNTADDSDAIEL